MHCTTQLPRLATLLTVSVTGCPGCTLCCKYELAFALQHEDGQAWAEAETGTAEPAAPPQQAAQAELADADAAAAADAAAGDTGIGDLDTAGSIILGCSVVVGIHPDQVGELLTWLQHK